MEHREILDDIASAVERASTHEVLSLLSHALERNIDPTALAEQGLARGLRLTGDRWAQGEVFLPELVGAAEAMKAGMRVIEPHLRARSARDSAMGAAVIGTVQGDIHDIGKSLVGTMLSASGFRVIDLGNNVPPAKFIDTAVESSARVIALSALLTTTMVHQADLIKMLDQRGLRRRFIVLCGGAPVTPDWARSIGADGTAPDAVSAARLAFRLAEAFKP